MSDLQILAFADYKLKTNLVIYLNKAVILDPPILTPQSEVQKY